MAANTAASKKSKGRKLELRIAAELRAVGIDAKRTPLSGAGWMKGDVTEIGSNNMWVHECKNQEKVKLWEWWEQTKSQAFGLQKPVLHVSGNYREVLTIMKVEDYMHLRACEKQLEDLLSAKMSK